jgi:Pro-kumamolisin, activation domain
MNLAIGLPLRNRAELDKFLQDVVDPASPRFRHYLTAAQFAERYGPTEADYQTLAGFFEANGLAVTSTHSNRMILDISGTVADVERTLHVNMLTWRHPTRGEFFAPDREPSLDASVTVLDITGLDNFLIPRPMNLQSRLLDKAQAVSAAVATGSGPGGLLTGSDFRNAYAPSVALDGAGQSVGLFELDGFYGSDVASNFQQAGLAPVPTKTVLLDGFSGQPGGQNVEVTLDIMMAAYMAPGLSEVIVYEGTNWNDVLNRMATDNSASQLSSSWSFSQTNATTEQIFSQMIAQGQSFFQASGDSGAYKGWIMPPADDPNVTVVGGTSLTTAGAGGPWQSETAWSNSGGGVSTAWPIPSYQKTVSMASVGGSATMRNIPDVALVADVQIFLICNNGQWIQLGGTSAAAPLWAGFLALANQQAAASGKPRVGFLNPLIYAIGGGSNYADDLHDITSGSNGFKAFAGYDLATGWGTPQGQPLIDALTEAAKQPAFGLSLSTSALSIATGTSGSSTITVNAQNGFSEAVNLAVSGLPPGVTASFSPATATTNSTLTLTASSSAAAGSSTMTITGTSGTLTSTARLLLTITSSSAYALIASPASLTVLRGAHATSSIKVTPQDGFNGTVALTASGLPSGVTAIGSPATATTPGTITFTVASSATVGTSTITITGASGSLHGTATISLTVAAPPSFTMTASPASLSVLQGASGASALTVTPNNGFNGTVAFLITGLPYGVTATLDASSAPDAKTLTFHATANARPGPATVLITATSGSIRSNLPIVLTITPAPTFTLAASPAALSVTPGTSNTSTVAAVPLYGFSGSVALSASGLPSGVNATFGPLISGKSVVKFTAADDAAASVATVTITGASGDLTRTIQLRLTVTPPPSFTLAAPSSLSVTPGTSHSGTIAITPQYGFNAAVAFSASGLPAGVTATFGGVTGGKCSATFAAANSAAAGVSIVTIKGTSGNVSRNLVLALTVTPPPSFTLVATLPSLNVVQGTSNTATVAIAALYGFNAPVAFSASGLPAGVTATFGNVTAGRVAVTFAASSTAATGLATVTIKGTSGSVKGQATVTLYVVPAPTFTLSASPAVLSLAHGATGTSNITVTPQNGFKGTVMLSVSGVPSGVSAAASTLSPTSGAVRFVVAPSAAPGQSTVTITGRWGALNKTATISLTVLAQ